MSSDDRWTLDPDSEEKYLTPWLAGQPDPVARERGLKFVADVVAKPNRPTLEDRDERTGEGLGVFSARIPGTNDAMTWLLDIENRRVVLVGMGLA